MNWLDTIVQGVLLGGLYALFAAGLSLMFGVMRLVNLAHGDLIVLAAFLILVLVTTLGLSPFVAVLVAVPIMFAIGWASSMSCSTGRSDRTSCRPAGQLRLSIVIQNALLEGFSADSRRIGPAASRPRRSRSGRSPSA